MSLIEFDVWTAPYDLSAAPDARLSTDDSLTDAGFNPVLYGEGDGFLEIHIDHPDTQYLQRRAFVRAVRTDTEEPIFDFILEEADTRILAKDTADKVIRWSGRGALYLLDRYRLGQAVYAPDQPNRGSVSVIDYWTWLAISPGGILRRVWEEGFYHPDAFYANTSVDFTRVTDSQDETWVDVTDYQTRIGTSGLQVVADMMRMGLMVRARPVPDSVQFQAFKDLSFRTDRTSATFTDGKVRFQGGVNVAVELPQKIAALRERTHTLTRRKDGQYATETLNGSGEPYMDFREVPFTSDPDAVEAFVGAHHLNLQKQSLVAVVQHRIDPVESGGVGGELGYFPSIDGHYWNGDLVTVHTGSGEYDLDEQPLEVAGIRYFLRGADWMVECQLGAQAMTASGIPALPVTGPSTVVTPQLQLCQADTASDPSSASVVDSSMGCHEGDFFHEFGLTITGESNASFIALIQKSTGEAEGAVDGVRWRPNGDAFTIEQFTKIYGYTGGFEVWKLDSPAVATSASADVWIECGNNTRASAVFYVLGDIAIRDEHTSAATTATPSVACTTVAGDLVLALGAQFENNVASLVAPTLGGGLTSIGTATHNAGTGQRDVSAGAGWLIADAGTETPSWTFNASRESYALGVVIAGVAGTALDGDGPEELVGTGSRAARCDHNHYAENLLTEETDTDLVLKPDGAGGVEWGTDATGGGGGSFVGCIATRTADLSVSNTTATQIPFTGTDTLDTNGFHDPATNPSRMTIPSGLAGVYRISAYIIWDTNGSGIRRISWYLNGVAVESSGMNAFTSTLHTQMTPNFPPVVLAVGDYVELYAYQSSGGTRTISAATIPIRFVLEYLGA